MKKILSIVTGINGTDSTSTKLVNSIVRKLEAVHGEGTVKVYDLAKNPFPHLEDMHFSSFQVPADLRTAEQQGAVHYSDTATADLLDADFIVIGVPLYNFNIPSTLKSWIDHISRAGITFSYGEKGPVGLVTGKKVYLALAAGGIYTEGPLQPYDISEQYLRNILGFLGMNDVTAFRAEGLKMPGIAEAALPKAVEAVNEFAF